jgi:hypothetical protein
MLHGMAAEEAEAEAKARAVGMWARKPFPVAHRVLAK